MIAEVEMQSQPGMSLRGGDRSTDVSCTCGTKIATLAAGERLLTRQRAAEATRTESVTCSNPSCGKSITLHIGGDRG